MSEPCFDVAHLGHVELLTNKFEESLDFFVNVYGLTESGRDENSVYLRAWDDYEFHSLKLTKSDTTGVGHIGYRASSEAALMRRVKVIEEMGCGIGWVDGDMGHGRAYRFTDPDGHVFELYYDTVKYQAPESEKPALKNIAQRYHGRGVAVRRIDHLNLLATNVEAIRDFMQKALGSRVTEQIMLDSGVLAGCWFTVNNKTYDIAYTKDATGTPGRFHHVTYALDQREDVLRAADIFLENNVFIETGPHKHAVQGTFFLYVYEPAGNRVEVCNAGARLILQPDWETVTWTESDRKKGQAWGLKTISSFHTHGTPPVPDAAE
ncbi:catechol 2,3-dioxygenase [Thalassospira sp. GO-4]|jgi:catechol 2,3-dioxygenase|uniref:catechol 2,3-dioxygenase n=1 Tax=Thalassospira sp. GO-4 TaxID=2946605 RepID=UPI000DED91DA|nr:catechol 2,3-dioxygenase [Thalassospira sp. GO-4]RCK22685.1 catechol 1,2-dioxygenase [Thalassospira profundimaris]URK17589.1 catechol 2,3-dioxygenase [Thalassospira sp. GO-4]